jgi:hypothetical protein
MPTAVLSITKWVQTVFGDRRVVIADLAANGSNTYATGGLALKPKDLGLDVIDFLVAEPETQVYQYDYANQKLKAYVPDVTTTPSDAMIEFANGVAITIATRCIAIGK